MKALLFGGSGLLGSELGALLERAGYRVLAPAHSEVDCKDGAQVREVVGRFQPAVVILAAARVGGILANMRHGSEYLVDNALMNLVTLKVCEEARVPKVLLFGSSCMYPGGLRHPIKPEDLLTGPLEPTNVGYGIGKVAAVGYALALRREGRCQALVCVPTNLYGDRDRFSAEEGHLVSSLIVKMHRAKEEGQAVLELWGDGTPRRDFLHASDAARACLALLEARDPPEVVHVGSGADRTVREIAETVARVVGFRGSRVFQGSVGNGTFQKLLKVDWIFQQGWRPEVPFEEGLRRAYRSYLSQMPVRQEVAG